MWQADVGSIQALDTKVRSMFFFPVFFQFFCWDFFNELRVLAPCEIFSGCLCFCDKQVAPAYWSGSSKVVSSSNLEADPQMGGLLEMIQLEDCLLLFGENPHQFH